MDKLSLFTNSSSRPGLNGGSFGAQKFNQDNSLTTMPNSGAVEATRNLSAMKLLHQTDIWTAGKMHLFNDTKITQTNNQNLQNTEKNSTISMLFKNTKPSLNNLNERKLSFNTNSGQNRYVQQAAATKSTNPFGNKNNDNKNYFAMLNELQKQFT